MRTFDDGFRAVVPVAYAKSPLWTLRLVWRALPDAPLDVATGLPPHCASVAAGGPILVVTDPEATGPSPHPRRDRIRLPPIWTGPTARPARLPPAGYTTMGVRCRFRQKRRWKQSRVAASGRAGDRPIGNTPAGGHRRTGPANPRGWSHPTPQDRRQCCSTGRVGVKVPNAGDRRCRWLYIACAHITTLGGTRQVGDLSGAVGFPRDMSPIVARPLMGQPVQTWWSVDRMGSASPMHSRRPDITHARNGPGRAPYRAVTLVIALTVAGDQCSHKGYVDRRTAEPTNFGDAIRLDRLCAT